MSTHQQPQAEVASHATTAVTSSDHIVPAGAKKTPHHQSGMRSKGGTRVSRGHQGYSSEEPMQASAPPRKKTPANHKDKETKSRPPSHRNHKEGSRSGGGASQRGKGGEHHSSHHRNGSGSVDGAGGRPAWPASRWGDNNPDHETSNSSTGSTLSGENWTKSSPSTSSTSLSSSVGLSTSASSMGSSSSAHRVAEDRRPPKRRGREMPRGRGSARYQSQDPGDSTRITGHGNETKEDRREDTGQKKKSKQIKFDLPSEASEQPVQDDGGDVVNSGSVSAQVEGVTSTEEATVSSASAVQVETTTATKKTARIIYDRDTLLALREPCLAAPPSSLKSMVDLFPPAHPPSDSPFPKDTTEKPNDDNNRPRHPSALSLIKEHDKHFVSKVSLSPQRRSFQRGCSWKDSLSGRSNSFSEPKTPPPKHSAADSQNDTHFKFDNQKGGSHAPRVIHHVPLHDQEQASGRQGKKGWRDGGWKGQNQRNAEPEPEWMEFGPTDRFDLIELKGFEEHEMEREGIEDTVSSEKDDLPANHDPPSNPENRGEQLEQQPPQRDEVLSKQPEEDNEFILDGFDFSTSVSICQALDLDEEEPGSDPPQEVGVSTAPSTGTNKPIKDPSELSNALLKALGVGKEEDSADVKTSPQAYKNNTGIQSNSVNPVPPANALTLEEVHARENILPSPSNPPTDSTSTGEGMEAFNKLLAVLGSKQSKPQKEDYSPSAPTYPTPAPMPQKMRVPRTEKTSPPNYGYPIEKEFLDMEEDLSGATTMSFPEPNLRRLEQLERMLETMDRMDPGTQLQGYHNVPAHAPHPPPPPHRLHQMDQRVPTLPSQLDRESRGWMQYQQQGRRPHPTSQQLAASRQQQMMATPSRPPNNWAVEMEQRRVMELRQMQLAKEKEMYGGPPGGGAVHSQAYGKPPSSKPNISLLPTAVMRHIHTSKPSQTATDLPKTTSISNRLDQDLTSKASQTHSVLNSLLNQTADLTPGLGPSHYPMHPHPMPHPVNMRMALPTGHALPKAGDLPPAGSMYPRYPVPMAHHGVPVHNPYMY